MPVPGTLRNNKMCPQWVLAIRRPSAQAEPMLPNNITSLRKARDLSQTELAKRVGTTLSQMGKLERSERPLSTDWIERIATALSVEPYVLIAPAHLIPTEAQLTDMLQLAQQRLPAGLPYSEWPRAVAADLHMRLLTLVNDRTNAESPADPA